MRSLSLFINLATWSIVSGFQPIQRPIFKPSRLLSTPTDKDGDDVSSLVTSRLPTSVEDQVRQSVKSLQLASQNAGQTRHHIRLLLPVIGATDLDDWPGGARQMMEAASPIVEQIMIGLGTADVASIQRVCLDKSDGVYAWMGQAEKAKDDCLFVLLPTAECVNQIRNLDKQVGPKRNLVLVNPQWRRRTDFGGLFGVDEKSVLHVERYLPTFSLTNFICEGESIRVLHNHGCPWRVYVREETDTVVDWKLIGEKPFIVDQPRDWNMRSENQRDGGRLYDFGQPSYQDIIEMLNESPDYTPKNPAERAAAAFNFIKDTL